MKMNYQQQLRTILFCAGCALPFLQSCKDTPDVTPSGEEAKQYAVFVTVGNTSSGENYLTLTTDDLMKDTVISPVNAGIEPDQITFWSNIYSAFNSGSFYYTLEGNVISKQRIINEKYKEVGNIVAAADSWQLGMMKTVFNNSGLNFLSWEASYNAQENVIEKNLYIVDTATMSVKSKNPIKFPLPTYPLYDGDGDVIPKEDMVFTPSSFRIADNKLYVGYYYYWETKIDTAYMLVCDYPALTNVKLLKDARLGHVSGYWYASSSSFTDENGDYYFTTYNEASKSYGVLRIKNGASEIDQTYAFDLKGNDFPYRDDFHAYFKNGLAFIAPYVVDVRNKTVVANLNSFGLGNVQITMESYVENSNELYVIMKTADARWFVAKYDAAKNTLTKGLEINGGVNQVSRIARLH